MIIYLKKKNILKIDDFYFKCTIGKNGLSKKKLEGDKKTPVGLFKLENLYYRSDRVKKPITKLKLVKINKNMCWCDDIKDKKNYNRFSNKYKFRLVFTFFNRNQCCTQTFLRNLKNDVSILAKVIKN